MTPIRWGQGREMGLRKEVPMWHIWQRAGMIVGCGILHLILEEFFRKLDGFFLFFFWLFWQMHSTGLKVKLLTPSSWECEAAQTAWC